MGNFIPKYQGGGSVAEQIALMKSRVNDLNIASSRKLAEQQKATAKKEGWFDMVTGGIKTGLNLLLPGTGNIVGAFVDPIARAAGLGADPSDIDLSERYEMFGGKEAETTTREGLEEAIKKKSSQSLINSIVGFAGGELGGKLLGGIGDKLGVTALDQGLSGALTDVTEHGNLSDALARNLGWGGAGYAASTTAQGLADNPWLLDEGWANGGRIPKYQDGGEVAPYQWDKYADEGKKVYTQTTTESHGGRNRRNVYKTYTLTNGQWIKTGATATGKKVSSLPRITDSGREEDVQERYMATDSESGMNEFLRSPQTAALVQRARGGDETAYYDLVEIARQQRPELQNKSSNEIINELKEILPNIDIYGSGYQEILAEGDKALESGTSTAEGLRAKEQSEMAIAGVQKPGGEDAISEKLYSQQEDVYAGMQTEIEKEQAKQFGSLSATFETLSS